MYIDRLPLNERTSNKANIDLHILSKWNLRGLCQTRGTKRPGLGHPFLDASRFIFVTWTSALNVVKNTNFEIYRMPSSHLFVKHGNVRLLFTTCMYQHNLLFLLWWGRCMLQTSSQINANPRWRIRRWEQAKERIQEEFPWIPCTARPLRASYGVQESGFAKVDSIYQYDFKIYHWQKYCVRNFVF